MSKSSFLEEYGEGEEEEEEEEKREEEEEEEEEEQGMKSKSRKLNCLYPIVFLYCCGCVPFLSFFLSFFPSLFFYLLPTVCLRPSHFVAFLYFQY